MSCNDNFTHQILVDNLQNAVSKLLSKKNRPVQIQQLVCKIYINVKDIFVLKDIDPIMAQSVSLAIVSFLHVIKQREDIFNHIKDNEFYIKLVKKFIK